MSHSLSCDSPAGHVGICRPLVHTCSVPCSYDIVDEEGEFRASATTLEAAGEVLLWAMKQGGFWALEERCECPE